MSVKCPKCQHENPDDTIYCGKCAVQLLSPEDIEVTETIEAPKEELTRGTTLADRYEIIEELGKGGMGRVYRVEDTKLRQEIALKLIKPEIAKDKKTIERFRNELKLAREIAHRNVCRMYDLNEEKGIHYITMEYVRGEDLRSSIRRFGQLPIGKSISIAKQICEGLAEAHRLGVVHRDLKSNNIMIDKEGNVRIMDFGIARSLEGKGITGAGVMIGTPEYMSPEQVEGKEVDPRSDIYSLGVILYEMVTGRVPFEGDTPFSIGVKQKSETPRPPNEINEQIPEDLNQVILKCMEKEKEKRYQSVGELHSELMNLEKGIPTTERIVPERKPLTSREITVQFRLKKFLIPVLAILAVVIIGLIFWHPWSRTEIPLEQMDKPSVAVLPFEDLSPKKDQDYFCHGLAESLINALTQIKELRVPAITSSSLVLEGGNSIQEIGEKLNVNSVLRGSIQKVENRVRIIAQLINTDDESLIWSKQYNRDMEDMFVIQDDMTLAIVDSLKIQLFGEAKEKLIKRPTENLTAFTLYLKGRSLWKKRGKANILKAIEFFELAIEEDPSYALAYAGIADSYYILVFNWRIPHKEGYPKAREAALKALELDNTLAEAHSSLASVKSLDWDWEGAEREYKQAIELNPGYATAHHMYSGFLSTMARHEEAITEIKLARSLDPLMARTQTNVGYMLFNARHYDQAIETLENVLEMFPNDNSANFFLGQVYLGKSMYEEALVEFQKINSSYWIGITYAKMGKKEEALKILKDRLNASKKRNLRPSSFAMLYFALEERDKGFEWLAKGFEERDSWMAAIKTDPIYDNIRSDPRCKALLKKMNLE
jgi:serine/threonine protein kinase/tetratricopeptide (TPR) repeat protein